LRGKRRAQLGRRQKDIGFTSHNSGLPPNRQQRIRLEMEIDRKKKKGRKEKIEKETVILSWKGFQFMRRGVGMKKEEPIAGASESSEKSSRD